MYRAEGYISEESYWAKEPILYREHTLDNFILCNTRAEEAIYNIMIIMVLVVETGVRRYQLIIKDQRRLSV